MRGTRRAGGEFDLGAEVGGFYPTAHGLYSKADRKHKKDSNPLVEICTPTPRTVINAKKAVERRRTGVK